MTGPAAGSGQEDQPASRPLAGLRVVVTGEASRASDLAQRVAALGAATVRLPVVAVDDPADGGDALRAACEQLLGGRYGWVIVTSANGVDRLSRALANRLPPASVRWAAVGPSTARSLELAGLPCHLAPSVATADALATALVDSARPAVALYPRAERVRRDITVRLRGAGWSIDEVVAYRTVASVPDPDQIAAARGSDAVLFTSGSAVEQTMAVLGETGVPPLVVTIGPSTSTVARDAGLEVAAEAEPHSADGLVAALVAAAVGP